MKNLIVIKKYENHNELLYLYNHDCIFNNGDKPNNIIKINDSYFITDSDCNLEDEIYELKPFILGCNKVDKKWVIDEFIPKLIEICIKNNKFNYKESAKINGIIGIIGVDKVYFIYGDLNVIEVTDFKVWGTGSELMCKMLFTTNDSLKDVCKEYINKMYKYYGYEYKNYAFYKGKER